MAKDDTNEKQSARLEGARGCRRLDTVGGEWIDAMAGRCGIFGYGDTAMEAAFRDAATDFAVPRWDAGDEPLKSAEWVEAFLQDSGLRHVDGIGLFASADLAIEAAILGARRMGSPNRYRTVGVVGSDHGRTALCRTLSGRPELQQDLGPLMAGFSHVAPGDLEGLRKNIDEQTAAVVVAPFAMHDGAKPLDAKFLAQARELCNVAGAMLVVDESAIPLGSCGTPLAIRSLAEIEIDAVILSAGLFGSLPGGLLVTSREWIEAADATRTESKLLDTLAATALSQLGDGDWLAEAMAGHREFAVTLAERLQEFEFIQDVHAHGALFGIELDTPASEVIEAAAQMRLRIESAGEYAVLLQLPLMVAPADREDILSRLVASLEAVERLAAVASV